MSQPHLSSDFSNSLISIIVPVFNESSRIIDNLDLLISEIEEYFPRFEVIVVSDGSTDGTNLKVFSFRHPDLKLLVAEKNMGKGHAVRLGFRKAQGDYILFIDGGMELHPREIKIFVGLMYLYQADIVIGSKRHPQSEVDYPWFRKALSYLFQLLIRGLFHVNVTDTQVGIKLFRKPVVDAILPYMQVNRYGFDLEVLTLAKMMGYDKVLEAPIRMDYFDRNSRFVVAEMLHVFKVGFTLIVDTLRLYRRMGRLRKELRRG